MRGGARPDGQPPTQAYEQRYRAPAAMLLVALILGIPIAGGLLALDLFQVRASLQAARSSLEQMGGALADVDFQAAQAALDVADDELAHARDLSSGMLWRLASIVPVVRDTVGATREIVEVFSVAVELGQVALSEGEPVLRDGLAIGVSDGRIDLEPLRDARDLVVGLPLDRLVLARDALASPRTGWVPQVLLDARADTLDLADRAIVTVDRARAVTSALPGFLGAESPRRYFVGVQTSAELRGTGGLIGFWGVLTADAGQLRFGESEVYEAFDDVDGPPGESAIERIGSLVGPLDEGVDADPAYLDRYGRVAGASFFSNVNLDPDLPTTARVALDLYELRTGEDLDGMILLDPAGLQRLLVVIGPELPVPPDLADTLGVDGAIPTDRFAQFVTADIYETLGAGRSNERKDALRTIGDAAIAEILGGGWDQQPMARAIIDAGVERHLQVFSETAYEQAAFTEVAVTGALDPPDDADLLAITANNAVGGKQDVHLGHRFDVDVHLEGVGQAEDGTITAVRTSEIGVTVDNPLPATGIDEYIIGNCVREDGETACFEGPPGWNWTWFSAWMPESTGLAFARTDTGEVTDLGSYRGLTVVDQFQSTPPEGTSSFELTTVGRVPLQVDETAFVYELQWWRQSKAIPDLLDVTVHAPSGWVVEDFEVLGGGSGRGSGVYGEGRELRAEIHGEAARLTGTVTAHTRLRVSLVTADE